MDSAYINQLIHLKNGETVSFSTVGNSNGRPFLVFPGIGNHRSLLLLLERVALRYQLLIINIDRPGSGLSNHKDMDPKTNRLERVIYNSIKVMKHLNVKGSIYILGQSCGAIYALNTAIRLQDSRYGFHVKHIFLVSPWVSLRLPDTNQYLRACQRLPQSTVPSFVHMFVQAFLCVTDCKASRPIRPNEIVSCSIFHCTKKSEILPEMITRRKLVEDNGGIAADANIVLEVDQRLPKWKHKLPHTHITVYHGEQDTVVPVQAVTDEFYGTKAKINIIERGDHDLFFDARVLMDIFGMIRAKRSKHKNNRKIVIIEEHCKEIRA